MPPFEENTKKILKEYSDDTVYESDEILFVDKIPFDIIVYQMRDSNPTTWFVGIGIYYDEDKFKNLGITLPDLEDEELIFFLE